MPVGFLSDSQARGYARFNGELTPDQLARYFHLDDADRAFVATHRGDHNRLGVAVQLGSLRMLGIFLEDPGQVPASALRFTARQLSLSDHEVRIPMKPAVDSETKAATHSNFIPAGIPI